MTSFDGGERVSLDIEVTEDIEALEAEITALSANLDTVNTGTGRVAVVKAAIKEQLGFAVMIGPS